MADLTLFTVSIPSPIGMNAGMFFPWDSSLSVSVALPLSPAAFVSVLPRLASPLVPASIFSLTMSLGILPDRTEVEARIDDGKFNILATGPRESVVEVGQQFAWIGAALRSSTFTTGIAICTPFVSSATLKTPEQVSALDSIPELACVIDFGIQAPAVHGKEEPGHCWHHMFRNPIMVAGFPIPSKSGNGPALGLEMPLNMISTLNGTERVQEFDGKVFIKGFSTMVIATKIAKDLIIWHYFYKAGGGRISYLDHTLPDDIEGRISLSQLGTSRHVVGWCAKSRSYAGK